MITLLSYLLLLFWQGGILLGPSALGRNKNFLHTIFPSNSMTLLDTIANIGLLFFLFLVGLELDLKSIRRTGKKAFGIAITGICVPFALGIGSSFVLRGTISKGVNASAFLIFMGVALSITAFPVLARILAELKLLTTDVGRMAMSAAAVNDVAAWILLALAIALSGSDKSPLTAVWVLLSGCGFVVAAVVILSPVFKWMTKQCFQGEPVREIYICATLAIVLAAGFATDFIGIHAMFGAFVVGVLVPKDGPLVGALVEKIEDLVSGLFLPLYFVSSGLKTNVATIQGAQSWGLLVLVIVTACSGKILGTFLVSLLCKVPVREALALGFLMNTKGLVELIVLNIGKDRKVRLFKPLLSLIKDTFMTDLPSLLFLVFWRSDLHRCLILQVLNDQTFAIMILMALFTTFITTPLVIAVYKPARSAKLADYKHRKIERKNKNTQLRMLTCFHSAGNIPSIINLLEASRGIQKGEELCVYAMHLMELSERSSAILMVHKARKNGLPFWNKGQRSDSNHVIVAFEAYQQLSTVFIRAMTAISSMSDIHEDICATAERKRTAIIILPFHKHQRVDGSLETTQSSIRVVNQNVLEHAQCSVGIFVDRGLGGTTHVSSSNVSLFIAVLFFGGGDDREALSYGVRMAEHPGIRLMVIRFFVEPEPVGEIVSADTVGNSSAKMVSQDDEFLSEFRNNVSNNDSVIYVEKTIKSAAEAMDTVQELKNCNLYLVGRTPDVNSTFVLNRSDCPELGPVGNLLTSPNFTISASVLVVQQYRSELLVNSVSDSADGESESS